MSLFGIGVEVKGSLESQTEEVLKECENVMNVAYKASGVSIMDAMDGLDAESGAMVGAVMTLYRKTKDLALNQAKTMDKLQNSFDGLWMRVRYPKRKKIQKIKGFVPFFFFV